MSKKKKFTTSIQGTFTGELEIDAESKEVVMALVNLKIEKGHVDLRDLEMDDIEITAIEEMNPTKPGTTLS